MTSWRGARSGPGTGARDRDELCQACAAIVAAPRQLDGQQRRRFAQRAVDRARAAHIGQRCRHHRHQRLAQQRQRRQRRIVDRRDKHPGADAHVAQLAELHIGSQLAQVKRHPGRRLAECAQQAGQDAVDNGADEAERQATDGSRRRAARAFGDERGIGEQSARFGQQVRAACCGGRARHPVPARTGGSAVTVAAATSAVASPPDRNAASRPPPGNSAGACRRVSMPFSYF